MLVKVEPVVYDKKGRVVEFNIDADAASADWIRAGRLANRAAEGDEEATAELEELENTPMYYWIPDPKCYTLNCKHFLGVTQSGGTGKTERIYCEAYPDGIQKAIAYGTHEHLEVRKDQNNTIVYEKSDEIKHEPC